MRAAFLGTPAAAVPALAALAGVAEIDVVVTQPDAARGRSGALVPPPIKVAAAEWGYRVAQPETHGDLLTVMTEAAVDVAVVVAYGRILRPEALAAVPMGYVNVHFSLLPRWRGAAPVERAILAGDATTGV
ncbi:MAG: formyltransferase family protein, partial [Acidimicrobiia bacterium]|nr:formyltransferase family protein [Acidimicrobiia bacterium]